MNKAINLITSFAKCVVTHNYRETNRMADWAANVVCESREKVIWNNTNDIPIDGLSLMDFDRLGSRQTFNHDYDAYEEQ